MASMVEQLLATPPAELLAELERIRTQERRLAKERDLLERAVKFLAEESVDGWPDSGELSLAIGPLRQQILGVMRRGKPGEVWVPREIRDQLAEYGNDVTLDNVRMTMRRMAESDELSRPNPKQLLFRLPAEES